METLVELYTEKDCRKRWLSNTSKRDNIEQKLSKNGFVKIAEKRETRYKPIKGIPPHLWQFDVSAVPYYIYVISYEKTS